MRNVASRTRRVAVATIAAAACLLVRPPAPAGLTPPSVLEAAAAPDLWLAPSPETTAARAALARAVESLANGQADDALRVFAAASDDPDLGGYAALYAGRAFLALNRFAEASGVADRLQASAPGSALAEAAAGLAVDVATAASDTAGLAQALRQLAAFPTSASAALYLRLGRAQLDAGDDAAAMQTFTKVFDDYAGTPEASEAAAALAKIASAPVRPSAETYAADLRRAERLFGARQFADARKVFDALRPLAPSTDRGAIDLRLAETAFHTKRYPVARDGLKAYLDTAPPRRAEAEFYYLSTLRELGREAEYLDLARAFVERGEDRALAEATLNDLGTYYILENEDEKAAEVFADQYRRFPQGAFAERAAWKSGWWAYKSGDYESAIATFESAAATMRRADFRPAWLYWSGRAHVRLGHRDLGLERFRQVIADYRNSYYGREAASAAEEIRAAMRPPGAGPVAPASRELPATIAAGARPDNASIIESLLAAGMYGEAISEIRRAQAASGNSPLLDATLAYALNRQGRLRPAITAMRRAYPQFMAAGGEALPADILTVIFPVDHWDLIQKHAAARNLDPYLMAALIAQESTFQADIRSSANAWGLMQVLPATGRRYAQRLGIRPFSTSKLIDPETNIRIGTSYFVDLLKQFGDVAPVLAAYNAGENRVARWLAERPGVDRDEFIDDIPFPETQNYVKRILGTAEDYRLLYARQARTPPARR